MNNKLKQSIKDTVIGGVFGAAIAVSAFYSLSAKADAIATYPNVNGGVIVISDNQGNCPVGSKVYISLNAWQDIESGGCYMLKNGELYWRNSDNGHTGKWTNDAGWTITDYGRKHGWFIKR